MWFWNVTKKQLVSAERATRGTDRGRVFFSHLEVRREGVLDVDEDAGIVLSDLV